MFDIIAAGEILIDLVDTGNLQFSGTVGGAPCNACLLYTSRCV